MPNGKPGDHPLTDMLVHGQHPFPPEIERLLRDVLALAPRFPDEGRFSSERGAWHHRLFRWERGEDLAEGRRALEAVLAELRASSGPAEPAATPDRPPR